jgi:hypothetical protein
VRVSDRVIGIVLGIVLGIAIVIVFVFLGSEETIDAPSLSGGDNGAQEQVTTTPAPGPAKP